jgi:hypothetical protein
MPKKITFIPINGHRQPMQARSALGYCHNSLALHTCTPGGREWQISHVATGARVSAFDERDRCTLELYLDEAERSGLDFSGISLEENTPEKRVLYDILRGRARTAPDDRYTIDKEFCGQSEARYVVQFCGVWISQHETMLDAWQAVKTHKEPNHAESITACKL